MKYSANEVIQYIQEEDVKFIRLAFCDIFGKQKNISIMPTELRRAFEYGIAIDASAIEGFGDEAHSDLLLRPDPSTLTVLPWRPEHGSVVRMACNIFCSDGTPFEGDCRRFLQQAVGYAKQKGAQFAFGSEMEFYLFQLDEHGNVTKIPYDQAGYLDIAPEDRGENVRREICLTLEQMGIQPESSHHEEGPGQNEIDFRYSDPLSAADNAMIFQTVVKTVAQRNGLAADFSPKPLPDKPGNGFHINLSVKLQDGTDKMDNIIAGILAKVKDITLFLNSCEESYHRFGSNKAPQYISWSSENRSQLVRIPAAIGEYCRAELRSPDPYANPYLAFGLLIYAGMCGIEENLTLPQAADINLYTAPACVREQFDTLPHSVQQACTAAKNSDFVNACLPKLIAQGYYQKADL